MVSKTNGEPTLFNIPLVYENAHSIIAAAERAGWRDSECGEFGTVMLRDDEALKIYSDAAYTRYLMHIETTANPAFPEVRYGPFIGDGLSAVILERLDSLPEVHAPMATRLYRFMDEANKRGAVRPDPLLDEVRDVVGEHGLEALQSIAALADRFCMRLDFKRANLMFRRATGQIVFTDPVACL